ncbi:MAG: ArnT family glycosyltransferase [Phycisphaerales bacterium]
MSSDQNQSGALYRLTALVVTCFAAAGGLAAVGLPENLSPLAGIGALVLSLARSGPIAGAYLLAALGYGSLLSAGATRAAGAPPRTVQWLVGIAGMLWLSHMLGVMGLLSGRPGIFWGWAAVALGVALALRPLLAHVLRREPLALRTASLWWMLFWPAAAVLVVAASNPPGALWTSSSSEAGAYDVQSYHLPLPKEWAAATSDGGTGRLRPLEHNVYSFLPSYMEAAYLHLAAMTGAGRRSGGDFIAGTGTGVIACQYLHAGVGIVAGLALCAVLGSLTTPGPTGVAAARARTPGLTEEQTPARGRIAGIIAAASMVGVPWFTVAGSLAYNELAVIGVTVAAIALALPGGVPSERPHRRIAWQGLTIGFLAGIACSAKPTSLFLSLPIIGIVLLARPAPRRVLALTVLWGALGGLVAVAPWLIRNALASGNPVFPFLHSWFGNSHWTSEQFVRFASAHRFSGSLADRFVLLFSSTRGLLNPQWSILYPLGIIGLIIAACDRTHRRVALCLHAGLVLQVLAWMFATHLQSRFLLPTAVPLSLGIGLGALALVGGAERRAAPASRRRAPPAPPPPPARPAATTGSRHPRTVVLAVAAVVPIVLAGSSIRLFLSQREGHPNALLIQGVEFVTGEAFAAHLATLDNDRAEQLLREQADEVLAARYRLRATDALYMVGAATPMYYLPGGTNGVRNLWYNSTWDMSPLGRAVRSHPADHASWTRTVRDALGIKARKSGFSLDDVYVLVDENEIRRLYPVQPGQPVWFDPELTLDRVNGWIKEEGEIVQSWPDPLSGLGSFLYRLRRPDR